MPATTATYREVTRRDPVADLRSLSGFAVVAVIGFLMVTVARNTVEGFDEDLRALLNSGGQTFVHVALVSMQAAFTLILVATPFVLLWRRRLGLIFRGTAAALVGGGVFLGLTSLDPSLSSDGAGGPSSVLIAATAALVTTLRPVLRGFWLGMLWTALVLISLLRILSAAGDPVDVVLAIGVGGFVGAVVLLIFGRSMEEITAVGVAEALTNSGLPVTGVRKSTTGGIWNLRARDPEDRKLALRLVDRQIWQRESLHQRWRRFRLRNTGVGDAQDSPFQVASTEAMVTMLAAEVGVRVPDIMRLARAPKGEAILAAPAIGGRALSDVGDDLTDEVLQQLWHQVAVLQRGRLAHRRLNLHHARIDSAGKVWLVEFGRGDASAPQDSLDTDVAELLASSYARVGAERAVAPALAALGPERVMAAVVHAVPVALTPQTRGEVKSAGGLDDLISEAAKQAGVDKPQPIAVQRFRPRTLLMAALLGLSVYILAPQFANFPQMVEAVQSADWHWLPLVLAMSVATYVGAGLGLAGGAPGHVPASQAGFVAVAGSFVATFSPPGVSTVGMNSRFLQKRGFPLSVAVAASTAKEAAVGIMHVGLLVVAAVWAGSSGALGEELSQLPPTGEIVTIVVAVAAVVLAVCAIPRVRSFLHERVIPAVRGAADAMKPVLTSPGKILLLLGGGLMVPLGYGVCLWASVRAFDSSAELSSILLVSLTAGALATAAPTPGGIGAVEAVLITALTAIGIPSAEATTGVLLYRVATFWLPILPGFLAFREMTKQGVL